MGESLVFKEIVCRFDSPISTSCAKKSIMDAKRIQTIGELTRSIKGLLETSFPFITVVGEISNLSRPHSGHMYFTLKDAEAQLRAVLFKTQQRYLNENLRNGLEVICSGRISVYGSRGEYQLIVDVVDAKGVGTLRIAFDELRHRLESEGLFYQDRKRPLPFLPRRIGVITSPGGAALHDFLHMAAARFPGIPIEIYPARVQGDGAAIEIAAALELANKRGKVDVVVLCRGGGSLEDLWSFNEEVVARAVFASVIPVVSAVGHEVDYTIADFVADYRSPTPTAAAEAIMPDRQLLQNSMQESLGRLVGAMDSLLAGWRHKIDFLRRILTDPSHMLARHQYYLDQYKYRICQELQGSLRQKQELLERLTIRLAEQNPKERLIFQTRFVSELHRKIMMLASMCLERKKSRLQRVAGLIDAVSPLAVLGRGYSIARSGPGGEVVRDITQVDIGASLEIILRNGLLDCKVVGKRSDS